MARLSRILIPISVVTLVTAVFTPRGIPPAAAGPQQGGQEFRAPDGSFTCRVPAGWRVRTMTVGTTPVHVLEPENGGEERILISSGTAGAGDIQQLTAQAAALVTQQLLPGFQPATNPKYAQLDGHPYSELSYTGMSATGQAVWWQGVLLRGGSYFSVLGGARAQQAAAMEALCRAVVGSIRPSAQPQDRNVNPGQDNSQLARYIVGRWTWYNRQGATGAATSKQITFYPNGRFEYVASTYVPDMPTGVDPTTNAAGAYKISGTVLYAQLDNGTQATYALEIVPPNGLKIGGDLFIRE